MPGRSSTILYWPSPSVTTERTFSISAGLEASTVTPGSTAPVVSFTTPAIVPLNPDCADPRAGRSRTPNTTTRTAILSALIDSPLLTEYCGQNSPSDKPGTAHNRRNLIWPPLIGSHPTPVESRANRNSSRPGLKCFAEAWVWFSWRPSCRWLWIVLNVRAGLRRTRSPRSSWPSSRGPPARKWPCRLAQGWKIAGSIVRVHVDHVVVDLPAEHVLRQRRGSCGPTASAPSSVASTVV